MKTDVENLVRQGLIEFKSIPHEETGARQVLTLTKNDHRFLTHTKSAGKRQVFYHGFTKPCEAHHDANLYRLYQKAASQIESQGGRRLRVVLDYELKKHLYRALVKLGKTAIPTMANTPLPRGTVSRSFEERLPCPTFESNTKLAMENGVAWASNLPPVTTGRNLTERVRAGFPLCAHACDVSKLRRILDQRELTAEILSL
jgi:hypothetical protein